MLQLHFYQPVNSEMATAKFSLDEISFCIRVYNTLTISNERNFTNFLIILYDFNEIQSKTFLNKGESINFTQF